MGIEPAFPRLHVRCANHCTITTTLLEEEFTGYQKYQIIQIIPVLHSKYNLVFLVACESSSDDPM